MYKLFSWIEEGCFWLWLLLLLWVFRIESSYLLLRRSETETRQNVWISNCWDQYQVIWYLMVLRKVMFGSKEKSNSNSKPLPFISSSSLSVPSNQHNTLDGQFCRVSWINQCYTTELCVAEFRRMQDLNFDNRVSCIVWQTKYLTKVGWEILFFEVWHK